MKGPKLLHALTVALASSIFQQGHSQPEFSLHIRGDSGFIVNGNHVSSRNQAVPPVGEERGLPPALLPVGGTRTGNRTLHRVLQQRRLSRVAGERHTSGFLLRRAQGGDHKAGRTEAENSETP
jgi:hypothetical protein